jgi:hypothetical protein
MEGFERGAKHMAKSDVHLLDPAGLGGRNHQHRIGERGQLAAIAAAQSNGR